MKMLRVAAVAVLLSFSVTGCAVVQRVQDAIQTVEQSKVNNKAVYVSASAVDALVITATNYLSQPRCNGSNGPICRSPAATKKIAPALRSLIKARQALVQFAIDHPGQLGRQGLQDAVQTAYNQLVAALKQFSVA